MCEIVNIFSSICLNMRFGAQKNLLIDMVLSGLKVVLLFSIFPTFLFSSYCSIKSSYYSYFFAIKCKKKILASGKVEIAEDKSIYPRASGDLQPLRPHLNSVSLDC